MDNTTIFCFDDETGDMIKARSDAIDQINWYLVADVNTEYFNRRWERYTFSALAIRDTAYVLTWQKKVYRIRPFNEMPEWEECPDLRYGHGPEPTAAACGEKIYVCAGGWQEADWTLPGNTRTQRLSRLCEVLDTGDENPQWVAIRTLTHMKRRNSIIGVEDNVYCIGGLGKPDAVTRVKVEPDEEHNDCYVRPLRDVEMYDPDTDTWVEKASLKIARIAPGVAKYNKWIFVLGGASEKAEQYLNTFECYNTITNVWQDLICKMQIPRAIFVAYCIEDEMILVGGEREVCRSIEKIKVAAIEDAVVLDTTPNGHTLTTCFNGRDINRMATVFMRCPYPDDP